jgi:hypothetical protein
MIKLEIVSVRRIDVSPFYQFFNTDMGIKEYIKEHFQDTGKLVNISISISEDYTTQTQTLNFNSWKDYYDFVNDEILQYQEKVIGFRYNKYHNITCTRSATEI